MRKKKEEKKKRFREQREPRSPSPSAPSDLGFELKKLLLDWNLVLNSDAAQNYKYVFGPQRVVFKQPRALFIYAGLQPSPAYLFGVIFVKCICI